MRARDIGNDSQLALHDQGTGSNDPGRASVGVLYDEDEVAAVLPGHPAILVLKLLLGDIPHRCQHSETIEKARIVIGAPERAELVALGERSLDFGREEVRREEPLFGHDCESSWRSGQRVRTSHGEADASGI